VGRAVRLLDFCEDCSSRLAHNPRRKGNRCQPCSARHRQSNLSPAQRAEVADRCRKAWTQPGFREAARASMSRAHLEAHARDPELLERRRAWCRSIQPLSVAAESPDRSAKISRARIEAAYGWCPLEYRDEYRRLTRECRLTAGEARAAIEQQVEADLRAFAKSGVLPQTARQSGGR
jgi:hypothetical protein